MLRLFGTMVERRGVGKAPRWDAIGTDLTWSCPQDAALVFGLRSPQSQKRSAPSQEDKTMVRARVGQ
eukprot:11159697-Lingulodinium_polyedra.AAC.1